MFTSVHHVAYAVADMDEAVAFFEDVFELELEERCVVAGERSFEMATFRCGETLLELQRPIDYPELEQFLRDHGPGINHVAFGVADLGKAVDTLKARGIAFEKGGAFVAGTGWTIANFDTARSNLPLFTNPYHDDHLAQSDG